MTTALKPVPERMALLDEIKLKSGGHAPPPEDCTHPEGCDREIASWVLGQDWTDHPDWESPVIAAFRRRLNDALPDELRQKLKPSMFDGIGTAGDGLDEQRGWMATDWSIRVALPVWLELAGVTDSAKQRYRIAELAKEAGIEVPVGVFWSHDASKLIDRLEALIRQPSFDFRDSPMKEGRVERYGRIPRRRYWVSRSMGAIA